MLTLVAVNLRRRPARTALTACGVAIGVGAIVALLSLTAGLERAAGGLLHLGKARLGVFQQFAGDLTASTLPQSAVARVRAVPGVSDATGVQLVVDAVPAGRGVLTFGIDPRGFIARRLVIVDGRRARAGEALLGDAAAGELHRRPGDTLKIAGRPFRIAGLYHAGLPYQDLGVVIPLRDAQALVNRRNAVTTVAVAIDAGQSADAVAARIERALPGTTAVTDPGEIARADANELLIDKAALVIAVVALAIGAVAVTNTMLMAVLERRRELALLAAVGWPGRQVATLVFGEGLAVSLLGAALGVLLGIAGSSLVVRALGAAAYVSPAHTASGLARGLAVGLAIGVLGGLYPAWRVTRLDPADGLRRE